MENSHRELLDSEVFVRDRDGRRWYLGSCNVAAIADGIEAVLRMYVPVPLELIARFLFLERCGEEINFGERGQCRNVYREHNLQKII